MNYLSWLLKGFIALTATAFLGVGGYFLVKSIVEEEPAPELYYYILMEDEIEILSDRKISLSPWLMDSEQRELNGRFEYKYDEDAEYIQIDENGVLSVLKPTDKTIVITVLEKTKNVKKFVNVKIIAELSEVYEIRDAQGMPLSSTITMEIGESYTFNVITMPSQTAIQEYFSFASVDSLGVAKSAFDVSVSANTITLTAVGIGSGDMHFGLKNENRHLDFNVDVPFEIRFPDDTLNGTVLSATEDTLLSASDLGKIERLVFADNVTAFSAKKYERLTGLKTMVFTANELVTVADAVLKKDLTFRIPAQETVDGGYDLSLYSAYRTHETWGEYSATLYPYLDDYKKAVVVYHNEDTYRYSGRVFNGTSIETKAEQEYTYIDQQTAPALKAVNVEAGLVEEYTFDGYTFAGWKDAAGVRFEAEDLSLVSEGIHVMATWTAKEYTVTLDALHADTTANKTLKAVYNQPLLALEDGEKKSWTFGGWYLSDEYLESEKVEQGIVYHGLENVTLYAKYTTTIALDDCGMNTAAQTITGVVYGKPLGAALDFSAQDMSLIATSGWTFDSWHDSLDYTAAGKIGGQEAYVREGDSQAGFAHKLYAKFVRQVTFDTLEMSEDDLAPLVIVKGYTIGESMALYGVTNENLSVTASGNGWTFKGWTFQPFNKTQGSNYGFGNTVLDSQYYLEETTELPVTWTVAFAIYETSGTFRCGAKGEEQFTMPLYYGTKVALPTVGSATLPDWTAVEGYTFVAWYEGGIVAREAVVISEDFANKVYDAKYNAIAYTVRFVGENGQDLSLERTYYDPMKDADDNVLNNDSVNWDNGRTISLPSVPAKVGHTGHWEWSYSAQTVALSPDAEEWTVPNGIFETLTLKAVYEANVYTITLNMHGVLNAKTVKVTYGQSFTLPNPSAAPKGYSFDYWYDESGSDFCNNNPTYLLDRDIELYAYYFIMVEHRGFNQTNRVSYQYGESATIALPIDVDLANLDHWSFAGWYSKDTNNVETDLEYDIATERYIAEYTSDVTTYYARWTKTIALDAGAGFSIPDSETITNSTIQVERGKSLADIGKALPVDKDIVKDGDGVNWKFAYWYVLDFDNVRVIDTTVFSDSNKQIMTLCAAYQSTVTVEIKYPSAEYGSGLETIEIPTSVMLGQSGLFRSLDQTYRLALNADEEYGYEHKGWSINGEKYLISNQEYEKDVVELSFGGKTLSAVFESFKYYVDFDANGGKTTPDTICVEINETFIFPSAPARDGYRFVCWKIGNKAYESGQNASGLTTLRGQRLTAKAEWTPIRYTVVYDVNQGDPMAESSVSVAYDESFYLAQATRTGYIHKGWHLGTDSALPAGTEQKNKTTVPNGVVTYIAEWEAISYTVVYDLNGGTLDEDLQKSYKYDESFTLAGVATKAWYRFVGWKQETQLFTAEANVKNLTVENGATVTLVAEWEAVEYTISYYQDNLSEPVASVPFTIESISYIQPIAVEKKEGYEGKWDLSALPLYNSNAVEGDFKVYPKYTLISYVVKYLDENGKELYSLPYTIENISNVFDDEGNFKEIDGTTLPEGQKLGYTFSAWKALNWSGTQPDWHIKEKYLQAVYTPIIYTLSFYNEDNTPVNATFTLEDSAIAMPAVTEKLGYVGVWNISRESLIQSIQALQEGQTVIAVYPNYTPIVYTITLQAGENVYEYSYTIENLEKVSDGYQFSVLTPVLCANGETLLVNGATGAVYSAENSMLTVTFDALGDILIAEKAAEYTYIYNVVFDYGYDGLSARAIYADDEGVAFPVLSRMGYKLVGWVKAGTDTLVDDGTVVGETAGETVTLTAVWEGVQYTVLFENVAGMSALNAVYDTLVTLPTAEKEGYKFLGWSFGTKTFAVGENAINLSAVDGGEVVLTAVWQANAYNVRYDANNGNETPESQAVAYGQAFYIANYIEREGYLFQGWQVEESETVYNGGALVQNLTANDGDSVTLVAVWEAISYTVVFKNSELPSQILTYDAMDVYFPEPPKRNGYIFYAWSYVVNGEAQTVISSACATTKLYNLTNVHGAIVEITAEWKANNQMITFAYLDEFEILVKVPIYFTMDDAFIDEPYIQASEGEVCGWEYELVNGGTATLVTGKIADGYSSIIYTYEGKYSYRIYQNYTQESDLSGIAPSLPEKAGYIASWKYVQDAETGNVTATAQYTLKDTETYLLIFDTQGGLAVESQTVDFSAQIITLPTTSRLGYNFIAWEWNGARYYDGDCININKEMLPEITLTAIWEIIEYTIIFKGVDQTVVHYTVETDREKLAAQFPDPAISILPKTGYVGEWKLPTLTVGNITVSPTYTPISYTVHYAMQGATETFDSHTVTYNSQVVLGVPTKPGYTFVGWMYDYTIFSGEQAVAMTMCSEAQGEITFIAIWEETKEVVYKATFVADGKVVGVVEFTQADMDNGILLAPSIPEKAHYIGNWADYKFVAADIVVEAEYTPIVYKVEYVADGTTVATAYYTIESEMEFIPVSPSKLGYNFRGWTEYDQDGGDKRVEAIFSPIRYTVQYQQSELDNVSFVYDQTYVAPTPMQRSGYTFLRWAMTVEDETFYYAAGEELKNLTAEDGGRVVLTAEWETIVYKITFDADCVDTEIEYTVESDLALINEAIAQVAGIPEKVGYTVVWGRLTALPAGGILVKPVYTLKIYYVLFTVDGQTQAEREWTIESGSIEEYPIANHEWKVAVTSGETTVYENYVLSHESFTYNEENGRYELTLVAVAVKGEHKIEFYKTDERNPSAKPTLYITKYYNYNDVIAIPEVPFVEGYVGGWDVSGLQGYILDGSILYNAEEQTVIVTREVSIMEIRAVYTAIQYTVTYDVNGGDEASKPNDFLATYRQPIAIGSAPTYTGYIFGGWLFEGTVYSADVSINKIFSTVQGDVVVLQAIWTPIDYTVKYYAPDGDFIPDPASLSFNETIVLADGPNREYYDFVGWRLEGSELVENKTYSAGTALVGLTAKNGGEVSFTAVWKPKTYIATFVANGETVGTVEFNADSNRLDPAKIPLVPVVEFYQGSWEPYTLERADITVNAVYVAEKYTITYYREDGSIYDEMTEYTVEDTEVKKPAVPEKTAYIGEWQEFALSGGDLSVYPIYKPRSYAVIFYSAEQGTEGLYIVGVSSYTIENTEITLPVVPTGYSAWNVPTLIVGVSYGDIAVYPVAGADVSDGYIVTFQDEQGKTLSSVLVKGSLDMIPSVPEKVGFTGTWDLPATINSNLTVRPVYKAIVYTVTFYNEKGEIVDTTEYTVLDHNIEVPVVPEKAENAEHYTASWDIPELTYGNLNIYPKYLPKIYTVYFYKEAAHVGDITLAWKTRVYTIDSPTIEIPATPVKEGYKDIIWSKFDLGNLTDLHVYAIYSNIKYAIVYSIQGGPENKPSTPATTVETYDQEFTLASYVIPTGYLGTAWIDAEGKAYEPGSTQINLTDEDGKAIVLTLTLTPIRYTIYVLNYGNSTSSVVAQISATYDQSYTMPNAISQTGYIFNGWRDTENVAYKPNTTYSKNLTTVDGGIVYLKSEFTPITYTIQYYDRKGNYLSQSTMTYNQYDYSRAAASEEGYDFQNWKWSGGTFNAGALIINLTATQGAIIKAEAEMKIKQYTVTISQGTGTNLTVKAGDRTISSGAKIDHGTTITISHSISNSDDYKNDSCNYCPNHQFTLTSDVSIESESEDKGCVIKGTLITMADGSVKKVEDLRLGDMVLVWDFATGSFGVQPVVLIEEHIDMDVTSVGLRFNDGTFVEIAYHHAFYDMDLRKFVYLDKYNADQYIGHTFQKLVVDESGCAVLDSYGNYMYEEIVLVDVFAEVKTADWYNVATAVNYNLYANALLSGPVNLEWLLNILEIDEDMKYDQAALLRDIETYGLFTYEELAQYGTKEQFERYNASILKIAIGKGLTDMQTILTFIQNFVQ